MIFPPWKRETQVIIVIVIIIWTVYILHADVKSYVSL